MCTVNVSKLLAYVNVAYVKPASLSFCWTSASSYEPIYVPSVNVTVTIDYPEI